MQFEERRWVFAGATRMLPQRTVVGTLFAKGASRGEGLGNKFLGTARRVTL